MEAYFFRRWKRYCFLQVFFHQSVTVSYSTLREPICDCQPFLGELDMREWRNSLYWHSSHKLQTHHWIMCLQPRPANRKQTISAKCWLTALQLPRFWLVKTSQICRLIGQPPEDSKCERKVSCDTCAQLKDGFKRNLPTFSTKKTTEYTEKGKET